MTEPFEETNPDDGRRLGPGEEFDLIERVRGRLAERAVGPGGAGARVARGSGDDAAVTVPPGATATSIDTIVEGVHFDLAWPRYRLADVGWKALAAALSDLAAMGASAGEAYISVVLPPRVGPGGALEIADGLAECAGEFGVAVIGGDVVRGCELVLTAAVVGHALSPDAMVGRDGARAGDLLCVTGELGRSAAALAGLRSGGPDPDPEALEPLYRPRPRLDAGKALAPYASAMIDLSDGLGGDAGHIAAASAVAVEIDGARVPAAAVPDGPGEGGLGDPLELALSGGEDYELAITLAETDLDAARDAAEAAGAGLVVVGRVLDGEGVELVLSDGARSRIGGFDQLR